MGKFKDVGCPAAALMEECNEVAQVIAKFFRFDENWDAIPEGQKNSRWEMLEAEMSDLLYQWERLQNSIKTLKNDTKL